jgi:hypothetical protein
MNFGQGNPVVRVSRETPSEIAPGLAGAGQALGDALSGELTFTDMAVPAIFMGSVVTAAAVPCRFSGTRRIAQWASIGSFVALVIANR